MSQSNGPAARQDRAIPVPKPLVTAWAAGPTIAPPGRKGKKTRRRARKLAAALAAIVVMNVVGPLAASAEPSFYATSPYVETDALVRAGAKTYEDQLAQSVPDDGPDDTEIAATTLEEAILSGGLSNTNMEMPDMMLAGISGDQMALAAGAAEGPSAPEPPSGDVASTDGTGAPVPPATAETTRGGDGKGGGATVSELAAEAATQNEDGYAAPSLGGDAEPIVDEYAAREEPDAQDRNYAPEPIGEIASSDPDSGGSSEAPERVSDSPPSLSKDPEEAEPTTSDELALGPPPSSQPPSEGSEETADGSTDQEPPTEQTAKQEPSQAEPPAPSETASPDDAEQAFTDPSSTEGSDGGPAPSGGQGDPDHGYAAEQPQGDPAPPETAQAPEPAASTEPSTEPSTDHGDGAPPEKAASDESGAPDEAPSYPYAFEEEEADDYAQGAPQGAPPQHSPDSEPATGGPTGSDAERPEPGAQSQTATVVVAFGDQGAAEDVVAETASEAPPDEPPGEEPEPGYGQDNGGNTAPPEQADADVDDADQTFSDPDGTAEGEAATGEQPQVAEPQAQAGQDPEVETSPEPSPAHGQAARPDQASAPEHTADATAGGSTERDVQDGAAPEENPRASRPASQGDDAPPPADGAPAQDRPQRPQQQRDPAAHGDRAPESQQAPPRPERRPDEPDGADETGGNRPGAGQHADDGAARPSRSDHEDRGHGGEAGEGANPRADRHDRAPRAGGGAVPNRLLISTDRDGHSTIRRQQPGPDELLLEDDLPFGQAQEVARDRFGARPTEPAGETAVGDERGASPEKAGAPRRPEQRPQHRPETGAQDEPGVQTFADPEPPSSERDPNRAAGHDRRAEAAPTRDATAPERAGRPEDPPAREKAANDGTAPGDELRASPKDGAERTPPVWDREGLPEGGRPRDRGPEGRAEVRQPTAAEAEQAREDRRAQRQAELRAERQQEQRAERQAERQAERRGERRAELQAIREDRSAERQAERQAEREAAQRAELRADRSAERQADLRASRRAERIEAREAAAQEAAAQEAADRAALRQQRRAERAAESAAEVQGFADQTQPRSLPGAGGGGQRWDAPAVEPSLPAPKAHRWANPQPVEPVIAEPAYQKPAPVRTPGAAAGGGSDPAPRVAANPVAANTSPVPARQAGAGFGSGGNGFSGNAGGGAANDPVGNPVGNPVGGAGGAAGALKGVMR